MMIIRRIVSSLVLAAFVYFCLIIDWVCGLMVTALIILALYEFFTMLEIKGISIYKYFGIGLGALIPLSIIWQFELTGKWELLFISLGLLFLILMQFRRRKNSGVIVGISTTIFGLLYVSWFLSFAIKVRFLEGGLGLIIALILITKLGDIGAYLIGSRFGKTPLMPRVSPKKTFEGAIGGLVFSVFGSLVSMPFLKLPLGHIIFLGLFLGILGQLGDLSESLMKRDCQVKDSSGTIPGIGGILDLVDSMLFTSPAFYFYMSIILKQ
ncbi:phosphatidate cytidylyltransferase [Candidatus Omnitrophota bacterium]